MSSSDFKSEVLARYKTSIHYAELRKQVDASMVAHSYDPAVSSATVLVESALRKACLKNGCSEAQFASGAELAKLAYHPSDGCLTPPYPVSKEANDGAFHLFRGFFLYLRNAFLHNATVMSTNGRYSVDFLALCQTLLVIINGSRRK